jgi:hypothetical protein
LAVEDDRYRMTTLQDAINSTRKGDFRVVFDLKSAFHHVRLHADSCELMGFKVLDEKGITRYYCYVVLVFGFKIAAQVLGRVLKPVVSFLIQNGIPVTLYIDDGFLVGPSKDRVMRRYRFALDVFNKAGLLINFEKSTVPEDASTKVIFLGVCIETEGMWVHASFQKVKVLKEAIAAMQRVYGSIPVRKLATLVGKLVALEVAFGPSILVGTRIESIQVSEASDQFGWDKGFVVLSSDSKAALRRVSASLDLWNGHPMRTPASEITLTSVLAFEDPAGTARKIPNRKLFPAQFMMASDASETTVAAYGLSGRLRNFQFTQALLPHEMAESSTHREMSAVLKTLMCCQKQQRMASTTTLWWLTDSENVARIFCRESGDLSLMRLALQVLEVALRLNLDLNPIWVSRTDLRLQKADAMTKHVNTDDWSIHPEAFGMLQLWFGKFTVDLFASADNFKVAKFYSYAFSADSTGVDAFSMSWEGERAYCAPPIALILRTIRKIEVTKMTGVLLIPLWRGVRFWIHAFPNGRHLGGVFKSFKQLKAKTRSWGMSPKDAFAGKRVTFLVLEIDSRGDGASLESVVSHSRCFGYFFGYDCVC